MVVLQNGGQQHRRRLVVPVIAIQDYQSAVMVLYSKHSPCIYCPCDCNSGLPICSNGAVLKTFSLYLLSLWLQFRIRICNSRVIQNILLVLVVPVMQFRIRICNIRIVLKTFTLNYEDTASCCYLPHVETLWDKLWDSRYCPGCLTSAVGSIPTSAEPGFRV